MTQADEIRSMLGDGYTPAQVRAELGCSSGAIQSAKRAAARAGKKGRDPHPILCSHCKRAIQRNENDIPYNGY